jgi:adenosine deaminase
MQYLNDHRVPLECCPSSNVQTGAVKDLASHPLKLYFDLGLRVTVNTDNRLITDTSVSKELYLVHTQMGVPFADIKSIILAGFKSSFQPFHEKQAALRRVGVELDKYDDNGVLIASQNGASSQRPSRRPRGSAEITPDAE